LTDQMRIVVDDALYQFGQVQFSRLQVKLVRANLRNFEKHGGARDEVFDETLEPVEFRADLDITSGNRVSSYITLKTGGRPEKIRWMPLLLGS
jgi:hypothetical protein